MTYSLPRAYAVFCGRVIITKVLKCCMLGCKVSYVRCINYSYNNAAKGIRLLDKNNFCYNPNDMYLKFISEKCDYMLFYQKIVHLGENTS